MPGTPWATGRTSSRTVPASRENLDQSRDHTKANEIEEIDAASSVVSHDPAGNITKSPRPGNWAASFDYVWDAWNRLVEVTGRGTNVVFAYNGEHKRITKTADGITRHFYYSLDWQILEERLDEETEPLRQYVWNPNPDSMDDLILRDEGVQGSGSSSSGGLERLYALNDLMNVTAITDDDGSVQERYGYDPFGESRVMDASFNSRTSSNYDWEFRYKTYPLDLESGLYQVRYRYLHTGLGRWMSRDPIGYHGGVNLYRFVGNDPVNSRDAFGLFLDRIPPPDDNYYGGIIIAPPTGITYPDPAPSPDPEPEPNPRDDYPNWPPPHDGPGNPGWPPGMPGYPPANPGTPPPVCPGVKDCIREKCDPELERCLAKAVPVCVIASRGSPAWLAACMAAAAEACLIQIQPCIDDCFDAHQDGECCP